MTKIRRDLRKYKYIFWDFDGVIKDSLEAKSDAFVFLFRKYGEEITEKIKFHHQENGGISRFEKIPIYLSWSGIPVTEKNIEIFSKDFSKLTIESVIASNWVPGIIDYLESSSNMQKFFLVTATPQKDIEEIVKRSGIGHFFKSIYGSPFTKYSAIKEEIIKRGMKLSEVLVVGDSLIDLLAAKKNKVSFILRNTSYNHDLQASFDGVRTEDFK